MKPITYSRTTANQMRLHVLPTGQFKTYTIAVYIGQPLSEKTVTMNALIPFVLRRGTERFPETKKFREQLDDMYGAGFGFDIYKRGDYQIVQFRMDVIHDQFVPGSGPLLKQSLQFLGEMLTRPVLEDGGFRSRYVEDEKTNLRKRIEAVVNDKIRYAAERCIEEMCKDEPYRLHPLGNIGELEQITPESLYNAYQNWLSTAPIDIYVVGQTTLEEAEEYVKTYFPIKRNANPSYANLPPSIKERPVQTVVERMQVSQGKLNMGLRTKLTYADPQYPALLMYNGILGGYPHSKLFVNVREKASLAYYASSRMDGHKGIITIQSGIEIANYEKAVNIIQQQLEAIRRGDIHDLELEQTKAMIANQLNELQDSAFELIAFDFNSVLSGVQRSVPELIAEVRRIDRETVQSVASQIRLDTIYFLRDQEGE